MSTAASHNRHCVPRMMIRPELSEADGQRLSLYVVTFHLLLATCYCGSHRRYFSLVTRHLLLRASTPIRPELAKADCDSLSLHAITRPKFGRRGDLPRPPQTKVLATFPPSARDSSSRRSPYAGSPAIYLL